MSGGSPSPVWINRGEPYWPLDIGVIEKKKNAVYVGDFCLKTRSGTWSEEPAAVFFNEIPPDPSYSQYFGLFGRDGTLYITNALSAATGRWDGLIADNGEIIYSRFRHDCRRSSDGTVGVDGGRDYFRTLGHIHNPRVWLTLIRDRIIVNDCLYLPTEPPAAAAGPGDLAPDVDGY